MQAVQREPQQEGERHDDKGRIVCVSAMSTAWEARQGTGRSLRPE